MGMAKGSYEECKVKRMEENKRRMEELKLLHLSNSLKSLRPKSKWSSIKKSKVAGNELVVVRRSARVAGSSTPVYEDEYKRKTRSARVAGKPASVYEDEVRRKRRDVLSEERTYALGKGHELDSKLKAGASHQPTLVKSMLSSYVRAGRICLSKEFCRRHLPGKDEMMTLVDEHGNEFPTRYLARKTILGVGWTGFVKAHDLADGDAIIFQKINYSLLKVYIVKASGSGEDV